MWIPITLAAATFQILRTSRQHVLRSVLSLNGAGFVRYAYGFPLALIVSAITFGLFGADAAIAADQVLADPRRRRQRPDPRDGCPAAGVRSARLRHRHRVRQDRGDPRRDRVGGRPRRAAAAPRVGRRRRLHGRRRLARCTEPCARRVLERPDPAALMGVVGGRWIRGRRGRDPCGLELARRRSGVEPGTADPDGDARDPDADQRHPDARHRQGRDRQRRPPLARRAAGRRTQPVRVGRLGRGRHAHQRRQGAHARPDRDRDGVRHLGVLAPRAPQPAEYAASTLVLVGVVGVIAVG